MGYTIADIMNKLLEIEESGRNFYLKLAAKQAHNINLASVAQILAKEKERHIALYSHLIDRPQLLEDMEISFDIYDRAAKLLSESYGFRKSPQAQDAKELIHWALSFEKENLALVLSIRGILVQTPEDIQSHAYHILSEVIREEEKHISSLEQFIR
jgi:hypothetical protein